MPLTFSLFADARLKSECFIDGPEAGSRAVEVLASTRPNAFAGYWWTEEADALERCFQQDGIQDLALSAGVSDVRFFGDVGETGLQRPGLVDLLVAAYLKDFRTIVVYDLDDLSPSLSDLVEIYRFLKPKGIRIVAVTSGVLDLDGLV